MPEYECAVAKVHKRLYGQAQSSAPVCCGKPMMLKPGAPQAATASNPQAPRTHEAATVPQPGKDWWQLWK
ncbi:MAG: hypothetical protein NTY77_02710 [Elusimicrobia bacterium]|nr:hypothetical protein [Elusimicrobiota bacterium]